MFAVILGMSAVAPAMAAPGNPQSQATTQVCHLFEEVVDDPNTPEDETEAAHWGVLYTNTNGATNGHLKHGDSLIGDATDPTAVPPTITVTDCEAQAVP